jgi:hypothetical protein
MVFHFLMVPKGTQPSSLSFTLPKGTQPNGLSFYFAKDDATQWSFILLFQKEHGPIVISFTLSKGM